MKRGLELPARERENRMENFARALGTIILSGFCLLALAGSGGCTSAAGWAAVAAGALLGAALDLPVDDDVLGPVQDQQAQEEERRREESEKFVKKSEELSRKTEEQAAESVRRSEAESRAIQREEAARREEARRHLDIMREEGVMRWKAHVDQEKRPSNSLLNRPGS
jgi:hypothetical protein